MTSNALFCLLQFSEEKDSLLNLYFKANRSFLLGHMLLQLLKEMIFSWKEIGEA